FGATAMAPATWIGKTFFRSERTRALFAGLAAHSFLSLAQPLSSAFAMILGSAAHAVGWPIPRGGAQSITNALCAALTAAGGKIRANYPVASIDALGNTELILCDVTPAQLLKLANHRLSESYKKKLQKYRYGPAVFKVDY